jgi:sugar transferase (PEP-CTERM system associated)
MLRIFKQNYPIRNIFFVVGEGIFIYLSVLAACWLIIGYGSFNVNRTLFLRILLITLVCQTCLYYNDLYDFKVTNTFQELGIRLLQSLGAAAIFLALVYIIFPDATLGHGIFIVSVAIVVVLIVSWRFLYTIMLDRGILNEKIILLGSGELIKDIRQEIKARKDCGYSVILELPEDGKHNHDEKGETSQLVLGSRFEGLADMAHGLGASRIVAAFRERRRAFPVKELLRCRVEGIDVIEGISFFEMLTGKLIVGQLNPSWLIFSGGFEKSRLKRFFKRFIDLVLSSVLILLLLPLILLVAVLIKIDSRGPVIFSQERVGQKRRPYHMHKFRSMVADAEKLTGPVWANDDDKRITRVGRLIRKTRFDEIPQLWNVLKGEMSFVGPRPEREFFVKDLEKQIPYYAERFTVKPGITGWAQINYGYGATMEDAVEKLNYDLFYIKNMTTLMDLLIVLRTTKIVLFGRGAR